MNKAIVLTARRLHTVRQCKIDIIEKTSGMRTERTKNEVIGTVRELANVSVVVVPAAASYAASLKLPENESLAPIPAAEQSAYAEAVTASRETRDFQMDSIVRPVMEVRSYVLNHLYTECRYRSLAVSLIIASSPDGRCLIHRIITEILSRSTSIQKATCRAFHVT